MSMPSVEEIDELTQHRIAESLNSLAAIAAGTSRAAGWHDPKVREDGIVRDTSPVERMMLIVSEVAEAMEAYRDCKDASQYYTEVDGKPEGVASEIADVIIRCFDYCGLYGIDNIGEIIFQKMFYNTTRTKAHGGRCI